MADETANNVPANGTAYVPGVQTSEYKLTKWITIFSVVVAILGTITEALTQLSEALPNAKWLGVTLTIVGTLSAMGTQVGYALSRGIVKAGQAVQLPTPKPVTDAAANLDK